MAYRQKAKDVRDEIASLDDPGSPERWCCIHVTCCEENGHERGGCKNKPASTIWKGRVEWFCLHCREYSNTGDCFPSYCNPPTNVFNPIYIVNHEH
jgi:hypothetical protein